MTVETDLVSHFLVVAFGLARFSLREHANRRTIYADSPGEVLRIFGAENRVAVLVLGCDVHPLEVNTLLERLSIDYPTIRSENVVLYGDVPIDIFQNPVDDDRIFYLARATLSESHLETIISAALTRYSARNNVHQEGLLLAPHAIKVMPEFCLRIAHQIDPLSICRVLSETVAEYAQPDQIECLLFDEGSDTLWSKETIDSEEHRIAAASGLVGFVAHTGDSLILDNMGDDARYEEGADGPYADRSSRFIAIPLLSNVGTVIAVLKLLQDVSRAPFSQEQISVISAFAQHAAVGLDHILRRDFLEELVLSNTRAEATGLAVFRKDSLDHHTRARPLGGPVLTTLPVWLKYSYLLMATMLILGVAFVCLAPVKERATGPMLIRARVKSVVTAKTKGMVSIVLVHPGDRVREGDLMARMDGSPGDSLVDRLKEECRAPADGEVGELNIRSGQQVVSGDAIGTIVDNGAGSEVIALLPGSYAPQLRRGMTMIFRIDGYSDSHEAVTVGNVGTEIIGPEEASRYAGTESAGSITVSGPVVLVRAFLPNLTFSSEGMQFNYHDGMTGQAEISVRNEPMIESLVPGLKEVLRHSHDEFRLH